MVVVAAILVLGHLGTGTVVTLIGLLFVGLRRLLGYQREIVLFEQLRNRHEISRLGLIRNKLAITFAVLSFPVFWPALLRPLVSGFALRQETLKDYRRNLAMFGYNLNVRQIVGPFVGYATALLVLRAAAGGPWPVLVGLYVGQVCLLAFLLSLSVGTWDLMTTLRRGYLNPYLAFGVAAVGFTYTTLAFTLVGTDWRGLPTAQALADAVETVAYLRSPSHAYALLTASASSSFTALASLALYFLVLKQIIQYTKFQRTSEDYRHIVLSHVNAGRPKKAQESLDGIPSELRGSTRLILPRMCVAIIAHDWGEAQKQVDSYMASRAYDEYPKAKPDTLDDKLLHMVTVTIGIASTSREHDVESISVAMERGLGDGALFSALATLESSYGFALEPSELPVVDPGRYPVSGFFTALLESGLTRDDAGTEEFDEWQERALELHDQAVGDDASWAVASLLLDFYTPTSVEPATVGINTFVDLAQVTDLPYWILCRLPGALWASLDISKREGDLELCGRISSARERVLKLLGPEKEYHQTFVDSYISDLQAS